MTTGTHIDQPTALGVREAPRTLRWAQTALALGGAGGLLLAGLGFATTTPDGDKFKYAADYWLTADGLPFAVAGCILPIAVHLLQRGRAGRLGVAGLVVNTLALTVLAVMLICSLAAGKSSSWGPTYILAALTTFVGLSLFAAGSWRIGLLPRWMLAVWPIIWVLGSWAAVGPTPLALTAFFITMAIHLTRRVSLSA